MKQLRVTAPRQSRGPATLVSDELASGTHDFLRYDAVRKPLQLPYDSPYKVLRRASRTMTLEIRGGQEVATLDSVKPAHLYYAPPLLHRHKSPANQERRQKLRHAHCTTHLSISSRLTATRLLESTTTSYKDMFGTTGTLARTPWHRYSSTTSRYFPFPITHQFFQEIAGRCSERSSPH